MINIMKESEARRKKLHAMALEAPKNSGVYLWRDESGLILYVGKAKSLRNRLLSYFSSTRDLKTRILVSRASSIEYITTDNEYEALLLENTLIKKHSPRYNINLKDGKTYPVIKITNETYPRLYRTRRIQNDGARYFGPFPDVNALDDFLDLIKRNYRLRQCKVLRARKTPCLYYHIGRCSAPCCGKITPEAYNEEIREIELLLGGETEKTLAELQTLMKAAAANLEFEKAARLRDGMQSIHNLHEQNAVFDMDDEARDYIAWAAEGTMVTFAVLQMRGGKLVGRDLFRARSLKEEQEILPEFLLAYYSSAQRVPPRIFVPSEEGSQLAQQWFEQVLGIQTVIETPGDSGEDKRHRVAMTMAAFNAREDAQRRLRESGDFPALEELRTVLSLPALPSRIEGFDIAHLDGRLPVASLITFQDGNPDRKGYRLFRLRSTDGLIDDYASMREVTSRRYSRLLREGAELPDLILIDGGAGQVSAVQSVLDELNLSIPIAGLAKQDEEIYLPGRKEPLALPRRSDALRLLQRVRDETHRFATTRNQKLRTKENTTLLFESLPGIGPKKAVALLKAFGGLEKLAAASAEELAKAAKLSITEARAALAAVPGLLAEREGERAKRAARNISAGLGGGGKLDVAALAEEAAEAGLPKYQAGGNEA